MGTLNLCSCYCPGDTVRLCYLLKEQTPHHPGLRLHLPPALPASQTGGAVSLQARAPGGRLRDSGDHGVPWLSQLRGPAPCSP